MQVEILLIQQVAVTVDAQWVHMVVKVVYLVFVSGINLRPQNFGYFVLRIQFKYVLVKIMKYAYIKEMRHRRRNATVLNSCSGSKVAQQRQACI